DGKITECTACHGTGLPLTTNGGPHGMHNVNSQTWINGHHSYASAQACGTCHGTTGTGTVISKAAVNRTFSVEGRNVSISKGTQIGCGLCHENEL
ncbi:MAG: cytochrome C, partial [Deltaproteobacteria bacterium]|nr:cytochrome C [Deltaproteobacteria bacterium]